LLPPISTGRNCALAALQATTKRFLGWTYHEGNLLERQEDKLGV